MDELAALRQEANYTRYQPGDLIGHYESFFLRANHPSRSLAFWIRYTIFSPENHPEDARGELWAVYFDGETGHHVAAKEEVSFAQCIFHSSRFLAKVGDAYLGPGRSTGSVASYGTSITWDLAYGGSADPLFLQPLDRYSKEYRSRLPTARVLVGLPLATFDGTLRVNGNEIEVSHWVGSQNHNWGQKHTDHYAWGQVAGFDTHPDSFLEVTTARLKIGPDWTPFMTLIVLRHRGQEFVLNDQEQAIRARGSFRYFDWDFRSETDAVCIEGTISAPSTHFVGLNYRNPPGGNKHCLNTKIASCRVQVEYKHSSRPDYTEVLRAENRAAFEILTDDRDHGIRIRA